MAPQSEALDSSGKRLTVDRNSACYVIVPSAVYLRVKILTDAGEMGERTSTMFTRNCQIIVKAVRRINWLSDCKRFTWRAHRSIHSFGVAVERPYMDRCE